MYETTFNIEANGLAGASHHHWIVEVVKSKLQFTFKYFFVHSRYVNKSKTRLSSLGQNAILQAEWQDSFDYSENWLADDKAIFEYYLNRPITNKERWKIRRQVGPRNFIVEWLAYFKNTSPAAGRMFKKWKK